MLLEEIRHIKSEKSDLRNFGITFGVVLGLLAGLLWWKEKDTFSIFIVISLVFFFLGLFTPFVLKPLQKLWMALAVIIGFFMTKLILSILFYVVFTFIRMGTRLIGKKFLDLKIDNSQKSYWHYREPRPFNKKDYERQF